jgi:hypothetical protein
MVGSFTTAFSAIIRQLLILNAGGEYIMYCSLEWNGLSVDLGQFVVMASRLR